MNSTTKARQVLERNRYNRSALTVVTEKCPKCGVLRWKAQEHVCKSEFRLKGLDLQRGMVR